MQNNKIKIANAVKSTVFYMSSPIGRIEISIQQNKLYSITKPKHSKTHEHKLNTFALFVKNQLAEYFAGRRQIFNIPLANRGSDFQKKVWNILQCIPYGQTKTYGEVASILSICELLQIFNKQSLEDKYLSSLLKKLSKTSSALSAERGNSPRSAAKRMSELLGSFFNKEDLHYLQSRNIGARNRSEVKPFGGARAVGQACARNPFLIVVPCHRVLSQTGLGGFAYGLTAKKKLLKLEQTNIIITHPKMNAPTINV